MNYTDVDMHAICMASDVIAYSVPKAHHNNESNWDSVHSSAQPCYWAMNHVRSVKYLHGVSDTPIKNTFWAMHHGKTHFLPGTGTPLIRVMVAFARLPWAFYRASRGGRATVYRLFAARHERWHCEIQHQSLNFTIWEKVYQPLRLRYAQT